MYLERKGKDLVVNMLLEAKRVGLLDMMRSWPCPSELPKADSQVLIPLTACHPDSHGCSGACA